MRYSSQETAEKHRRILDNASRLFRERGLAGVGVAEIMAAAGLTHGPFYNHFASKAELVSKSIEAASDRALNDLRDCPSSLDGRDGYISGYLSSDHCDAPGAGCLLAALAVDVARAPEAKPAFTTHLKALIEQFSSRFPWKRGRGERGDAIHALAAMVGALVLARATDDERLADEILSEVRTRILSE